MTDKEQRTLHTCPLFADLSAEQTAYAMTYFDAQVRRYAKGSFLHCFGAPLTRFGLVLSGWVEICTTDFDGGETMMNGVGVGDTFGESLAYLKIREAPVYIVAREETSILWLSPERLWQVSAEKEEIGFLLHSRFVGMLASRALQMNDRIQILSQKSLRERLLLYLTQCQRRYGGNTFGIPFDRERLAVYLGVNRSALSRELSAMQKDGILTYYRNTFKLHPQ